MSQSVGAVGVPLVAQALYPPLVAQQLTSLANQNRVSLPAGGDVIVPPGDWLVTQSLYTQMQILDPVTQTWAPYISGIPGNTYHIESDGTNMRVINPTGFPIGVIVNQSGGGFTSAPTITASAPAGAIFLAIVGGGIGSLQCQSVNTNASGLGYSVAPILCIAPPPTPGVQATATCTVSAGGIATFTIVNPGAGYTSSPTVVAIPQGSDLNFTSPTSTTTTANATVTALTSNAGVLTAVLLTNEGTQVSSVAPNLVISGGGGSGALITAIPALTITGITVTTGGSGFTTTPGIVTYGGSILSQTSGIGASTNSPYVSTMLMNPPRQALIGSTQGSGSGVQVGSIIDGGLFTAIPVAVGLGSVGGVSGSGISPVFALTMGGANDTVFMQKISG